MKKILLFDTSIGTDNIGDDIIVDYCYKQLLSTLGKSAFMCRTPTHLEIGKTTYQLNRESEYSFVLGPNILKSTILWNKKWKLSCWDVAHLRNLCLMGAGWGSYTKYDVDPYTKWVYKKILTKKVYHSVRDSYTEKRLKAIGVDHVVNTACPTMWNLTPEYCSLIPKKKAKSVVTALTFYRKDVEKDLQMLEILYRNYERIYLWPQQIEDLEYLAILNLKFNVEILHPSLSAYDYFLLNNDTDFIGSRLHGGIRALNFKKRTLIVGVDNRAIEISRDTNLPVINREDIVFLDEKINKDLNIDIYLPLENIRFWKSQFI